LFTEQKQLRVQSEHFIISLRAAMFTALSWCVQSLNSTYTRRTNNFWYIFSLYIRALAVKVRRGAVSFSSTGARTLHGTRAGSCCF
jgi:hypothetical protein